MRRDDEEIWKPTLRGDPLNWLIEQVVNKPGRWHYRRRWRHNPQPETGDQPLSDKQGRPYWLRVAEGDSLTVLKIFYCGEQIGYVNLVWFQDEEWLDLSDIALNKDHRARGLGTQLIMRIEEMGRQQGAQKIKGRVTASDIKVFPGLLDWYQKQGYTVKSASADDPKNTVARIEKAID